MLVDIFIKIIIVLLCIYFKDLYWIKVINIYYEFCEGKVGLIES